MIPHVLPATEEHEEAVLAFFQALGLAAPVEVWQRAFGASCPRELAAQPWIASTHDEGIIGFLLAHPARIFLHGEFHDAHRLTGLTVADGKPGDEAGRRLLEHFLDQAGLLLAFARTTTEVLMYRRWNWRFVAPYTRMRFDPARAKAPREPLQAHPQSSPAIDHEALTRRLTDEDARFFHRGAPAEDHLAAPRGNPPEIWHRLEFDTRGPAAWLKLRETASPASRRGEWLLLDIRAPLAADEAIARALATLARTTRRPVHATFLRPTLEEACRAAGAATLPPRWGLFTAQGRQAPAPLPPQAFQPGGHWTLTAVDAEGDLEG